MYIEVMLIGVYLDITNPVIKRLLHLSQEVPISVSAPQNINGLIVLLS